MLLVSLYQKFCCVLHVIDFLQIMLQVFRCRFALLMEAQTSNPTVFLSPDHLDLNIENVKTSTESSA